MRIIWLKIIETSGARIYSLAISIISLFLTARLLGPDGRGTVASVIAWVSLFATVAGLSLGQVAQYRIQEIKSTEWLPKIFGTLTFLVIILSLLASIAVLITFYLSEGQLFRGISGSLLAVGILMVPLIIWEDYGSFLLSATNRLRTYNLSQVVGRTIGLIILLVTVYWYGLGVLGAIVSQLSGQLIVALIGFLAIKRLTNRQVSIDIKEIKLLLKGASKLHPNTVGTFILVQSNILMLNHFASKAEIGWYQLSYQIIMTMLAIPQAASMVLFSRMAEIGPNDLWPEQKRVVMQVLVFMLFISLIAYFLMPFVITLLAGPSFKPSIKVFHLLLPVVLGMSLAILLTNQWIGRGIFIPSTILTLGTAIANLLINFFTIPRYGMIGAVWSSLVVFVGITVLTQLFFAYYCEKAYLERSRCY